MERFTETLSDRLFHEDEMYAYIEAYARENQMQQTLRALPFARKCHDGQFRKGGGQIPFIYHPLLVACHALMLGLADDTLVAAALLHDVCEDCHIMPEELPVGKEAQKAVALLTKSSRFAISKEEAEQEYYGNIAQNGLATMIKLLDRCNNVSSMSAGFEKERMLSYLHETEKWFYPLMTEAGERYPQYAKQIFLIRYHISSVLESIKHQVL